MPIDVYFQCLLYNTKNVIAEILATHLFINWIHSLLLPWYCVLTVLPYSVIFDGWLLGSSVWNDRIKRSINETIPAIGINWDVNVSTNPPHSKKESFYRISRSQVTGALLFSPILRFWFFGTESVNYFLAFHLEPRVHRANVKLAGIVTVRPAKHIQS